MASNEEINTIYKLFMPECRTDGTICLPTEARKQCIEELKNKFGEGIAEVMEKYYQVEFKRKMEKKRKECLSLGEYLMQTLQTGGSIFGEVEDKIYFKIKNNGDLHDSGISEYYYGARSEAREEVGYGDYELYAAVYIVPDPANPFEKVDLLTLSLDASQETEISDEKVYFDEPEVGGCCLEYDKAALISLLPSATLLTDEKSAKEEFSFLLETFTDIVMEHIKCEESAIVIEEIKNMTKKEINLLNFDEEDDSA